MQTFGRSRERVLCADDEDTIAGWLAETLNEQGFEVETAVDGHHALYRLATEEPGFSLLITDARMPRMDGWGLIHSARAQGFNGPIIVFSGSIDDYERARYAKLSVDAFLPKPSTPAELLQTIRQTWRQRSRR